MKKLLAALLALCLLLPAAVFADAAEEEADAFTSASVTDYFGTLMDPAGIVENISAYNGFFAVATAPGPLCTRRSPRETAPTRRSAPA